MVSAYSFLLSQLYDRQIPDYPLRQLCMAPWPNRTLSQRLPLRMCPVAAQLLLSLP